MTTLHYLATPYSKYADGIEAAFEDAARLAGRLLKAGHIVYSPIAHTHPLAMFGKIEPLNHGIWIPFDEVMMSRCDSLLVALMPGWRESYGVQHEIKVFADAGKPIAYVDVRTATIVDRPSGWTDE